MNIDVDIFEKLGYAVIQNVIDTETVVRITKQLENISSNESVKQRGGIRNLLHIAPFIKELAESNSIRETVELITRTNARVVRAIYFDKTPKANWKVAWHQDLTIAVRCKVEIDGFASWSIKAGVPHVQPPVSILEDILTVRIHLDETDESNGALKVIAGSHRHGRLGSESIKKLKNENATAICPVSQGGLMLMRPLLLHASSAAINPKHRRVVHLEYSSDKLPNGLEWFGT
ncbi:MAG: phytanoyl-CoA dioxygenase family protein [Pyrinomonadaceae bacterium]